MLDWIIPGNHPGRLYPSTHRLSTWATMSKEQNQVLLQTQTIPLQAVVSGQVRLGRALGSQTHHSSAATCGAYQTPPRHAGQQGALNDSLDNTVDSLTAARSDRYCTSPQSERGPIVPLLLPQSSRETAAAHFVEPLRVAWQSVVSLYHQKKQAGNTKSITGPRRC